MNTVDFTFSDTIMGYVTAFDRDRRTFRLRTSDGRDYEGKIAPVCYAEMIRNLGDGYADGSPLLQDMKLGSLVFAYGIFYPEQETHHFEALHLVFPGRSPSEYVFERQDWWTNQIRSLGDFYLRAQFEGGPVDYRHYRTQLDLYGRKTGNPRQEIDTISRLVYGFASAYMMTGDDRYLEGAERGTEYLREQARIVDDRRGVTYWCHALDVQGGGLTKIIPSQFNEDTGCIPCYEQIYALAGPVQTFRITGDPAILRDAEGTLRLFERCYRDPELGGYFSHLEVGTLDPRAESLAHNRAKKNWNSVGDHAPAYLINLVLATRDPRYAAMLADTGNTIAEHFQDYDNSPFVQEKFYADWTHDTTFMWQQNRGVVGHNLKIAWNLMRINSLQPNEQYLAFARKIAEEMPKYGRDRQRGGWYDVVERTRRPGEEWYRCAFHDRKAWWQQEQGILAYLILAGCMGDAEYLRLARESSAFYNAWFLDHDAGAVYFNVLNNGLPYLLGTERQKGSHSMSGYHSFELAYLAAVYGNLLVTKQPLDLYFKPRPDGFPDNILRVAPDLLPPGSVRLESVTIDDRPHTDFQADTMEVRLPQGRGQLRVKAHLVPAS